MPVNGQNMPTHNVLTGEGKLCALDRESHDVANSLGVLQEIKT